MAQEFHEKFEIKPEGEVSSQNSPKFLPLFDSVPDLGV